MKDSCLKNSCYLLLLVAIASCNASKKSVTKQQSSTDSTATQSIQKIQATTIDSTTSKIDLSKYTRTTEIKYQPLEVDSALAIMPGAYTSKSSTPGKKTIYIPIIRITETGNNNITEKTHLQRKDTAALIAETATTLHKEDKITERKKISIGFNFWWLLLLIPLVLLSPAVRKKLISIFKFPIP